MIVFIIITSTTVSTKPRGYHPGLQIRQLLTELGRINRTTSPPSTVLKWPPVSGGNCGPSALGGTIDIARSYIPKLIRLTTLNRDPSQEAPTAIPPETESSLHLINHQHPIIPIFFFTRRIKIYSCRISILLY